MNLTNMLGMMQNPQMFIMCQLMQENPQVVQQCQQMFSGKSRAEQVSALRKLYKSKGMDLNSIARQYGVKI